MDEWPAVEMIAVHSFSSRYEYIEVQDVLHTVSAQYAATILGVLGRLTWIIAEVDVCFHIFAKQGAERRAPKALLLVLVVFHAAEGVYLGQSIVASCCTDNMLKLEQLLAHFILISERTYGVRGSPSSSLYTVRRMLQVHPMTRVLSCACEKVR
jgi:hypothetical protein